MSNCCSSIFWCYLSTYNSARLSFFDATFPLTTLPLSHFFMLSLHLQLCLCLIFSSSMVFKSVVSLLIGPKYFMCPYFVSFISSLIIPITYLACVIDCFSFQEIWPIFCISTFSVPQNSLSICSLSGCLNHIVLFTIYNIWQFSYSTIDYILHLALIIFNALLISLHINSCSSIVSSSISQLDWWDIVKCIFKNFCIPILEICCGLLGFFKSSTI